MPKVTDDHRIERRRQIAVAALTCFSRKGFEGTSMADIIAESGLSAGSLYLHYKNKNDLIEHVVADVMEARGADLMSIAGIDPLPHPTIVIRRFVEGVTRELGGSGILLQVWALSGRDPVLTALVGDFMQRLRGMHAEYITDWLRQNGVPEEPAARRAALIAPLVLGLCQGYLVQSAVVPDFDAEGYLASLAMIDFGEPVEDSLGA
ncbi:MAG: TetR/AcrR family transcriptional regulator [Herbiconiux sp.]|nr:TetR/AcrR family transcriptional regulator [Herbiconiux sp.]